MKNRRFERWLAAFNAWSKEHDVLIDFLLEKNIVEYDKKKNEVDLLAKNVIKTAENL